MKPTILWVGLILLTCGTTCYPYLNTSNVLGPNISHFAVSNLPDVDYDLPQNWAGQIGIPGTRDDALFFWLFEAESDAQRNSLISKSAYICIARPNNYL